MNRSDYAVRSSSQPAVTILTNPDEELKSVDHQLQQLEVIGKPTEFSPEQLSPPQSPAVAIIKEQLNEVTPTTVSHGAVSTAMKEVEYMLEQQQGSHSQVNQHNHMYSNTASNDKELPQIEPSSPVQVKSAPIVETPEPLSTGPSLPLLIQDMNDTSNNPTKFKPMPNPDFEKASSTQDQHLVLPENIEKKEYLPELLSAEEHTEITMRHDRSLSAQEIRLEDNSKSENKEVNNNSNKREDIEKNKENQVDDDDDDDEEEEEVLYKSRLPRSTPKDEKWVISSIRRPQQLPVRAVNAKMSDSSMNRNSMSPPVNQSEEQLVAEEKPKEEARQPKVHRPLVPLTIDIPNAINKAPSHPNIHTITQAVVEDNRRHSHPSPIQQQPMESTYHAAPTDRNMIRSYINQTSNPMNPEIRPAPWLDEGGNVIDEQQPYHPPSNNNHGSYYGNTGGYPQQYVGPRGSSLKMNPEQLQQLHQELYQHDDNNNKKRSTPVAKLQNEKHKDSKAGRFSLPFFGGKKDKKKEKEAAAVAAVAAKEVASAPTSFYGNTSYRPPPQDAYHRPQSQVVYQLPQQVHSPPPQVQSPPLIQQQQVPPELIETTIATANLPPSQQQQEQPPSSESDNRNCIGYARALWTFEANVNDRNNISKRESS
jgi:hypothetical protein